METRGVAKTNRLLLNGDISWESKCRANLWGFLQV